VRAKFIEALQKHQALFGLEISDQKIERLAFYYELVAEHNPILHLVAPCTPAEFATRHILESLTILEYLPINANFADVGSGAGLPSVPCLLVRDDLSAVLVESKEKKAGFLQKVFAKCEVESRAIVVNRQFSEIKKPDVSYISCRALDKFQQNLHRLIKWSDDCTLLFFGGPNLREGLQMSGFTLEERLMPLSEQRYLFVGRPSQK